MHTEKPTIQRLLPSLPPIAILGVPFDNLTIAETVTTVEQMIASGRPHYLATANVDFLVQAQSDVELRHILADAHVVLCDGTPLLWASRLLGNRLPERVAGSDLVPELLKVAAEKKYRVFLLGATPESVEQAACRVTQQHPSIVLAGCYSPPHRSLLKMDHEEISKRVREAKPDLLFVAFGCPKAEKWISMHYRELGVPVAAGVGATIDFLAGRVKRAPRWMQRAGMEWLYRLAREPRRLFRRYVKDLWAISWRIVAQWTLLQLLPRLFQRNSAKTSRRWWDGTTCVGPHCVIDLSGLRFIDSTDVGILLVLQKRLRAEGRHLVLVSVSRGVRCALRMLRLQDFFDIAPDFSAAEQIIQRRTQEEDAIVTRNRPDDPGELAWHGEITAANADKVWSHTRQLLGRAAPHNPVAIDLSQARFIDTSGLTIMVRIQRWAWRKGIKLVFTGAQDAVREVLHEGNLDLLLLEKPELNGLITEAISPS
jgi:N-acetylglucosaminyldiphosphoundecaprenol N-acetyl-beta-D-mannosaminyltransferase